MRAYIGPAALIPAGGPLPARAEISGVDDVVAWCRSHRGDAEPDGTIPATWIIDAQGRLWLADRHSEHAACARGEPVQTAGELFLADEPPVVIVARITNQSTGYAPPPDTWAIVADTLDRVGLACPEGFEPALEFRRCEACGELSILKVDETCPPCGALLPAERNV